MAMASTAAEELGIPKEHVVVASTGVIGRKFPTEKVVTGIRENVKKLTSRNVAGSFAANAILTTDTFAKEGYVNFKLDGQQVNMAGIAKGSGMIHPNMGTMLAFIVCDVNIDQKLMDRTFREAVDKSFNMITVDGDTSTNDIAVLMCNGMAGNKEIKSKNSKDFENFREKLEELCIHLATQIVSDGEGATKMVEYKVMNAPSEKEARQIIRTVSDSSLVKTAIFGRDSNWGRIIAAAGRSGVDFDPEKLDLMVGNKREMVQVLKDGSPTNQDLSHLKRLMRSSGIKIVLNMNQGEAEALGWGTDLTFEYVRFNSQYTT
jgi:glutamate N-acetyltransferase/amino-acid N-acetyltransferase